MSVPDFVNENLKTIKVLHQLLMAVSAAILAFALRPDLTPDYKAALDELAAVVRQNLRQSCMSSM
jgi:hypothetical protein